MIRFAMALLILAAPLAAYAQQAETAAAPALPPQSEEDPAENSEIVVEGEKPKRICETRSDTGSIIPKRICRTPEQVAQEQERARIMKDRLSSEQQTAQHTRNSRDNR